MRNASAVRDEFLDPIHGQGIAAARRETFQMTDVEAVLVLQFLFVPVAEKPRGARLDDDQRRRFPGKAEVDAYDVMEARSGDSGTGASVPSWGSR